LNGRTHEGRMDSATGITQRSGYLITEWHLNDKIKK
jgi:hypothetical protein